MFDFLGSKEKSHSDNDLHPDQVITLLASGGDNARERLDVIACLLEKRVSHVIAWYLRRKRWPAFLSRTTRHLAVLLFVFGSLMPLLGSLELSWVPSQAKIGVAYAGNLGYVLLAFAGALVIADRFLGFSTTWMRFMTTQMAMQRELEGFQLQWMLWHLQNTEAPLSADAVNKAIALLVGLQNKVANLVDQEFQTWLTQFQQELAALQVAMDKSRGKAGDNGGAAPGAAPQVAGAANATGSGPSNAHTAAKTTQASGAKPGGTSAGEKPVTPTQT